MTGTSIHLALFNLTQVEQLGAKTRVHVLAVLKPSRDALIQINPTLASEPSPYHEITYPLRAGDGLSFSQNSTMAVPGTSSTLPPKTTVVESNNAGDRLSLPPTSTITRGLKAGDGLSLSQDSTIVGGSDENQAKLTVQNNIPLERDLQASRTFAVLRMLESGDNPWDLGSLMLNWKTVMGDNVIDWFLPIKRSPCCNHEQSESQFSVGPWVDLLRVRYGFLEPQNIRAGGKRFQRRAGPELSRAKTSAPRRAKRSTAVSNVGEASKSTNDSIRLQSLDSHARQ
jgi:palmitoyltransferase